MQLWLTVLAFVQAGPVLAHEMKRMDMPAPSNPASRAYMREMSEMHDAMQGMKPTNDTGADFVMMMKPHHRAAIDMAKTYLSYGKDPDLVRLAKQIISDQDKEVEEMTAWQMKHGHQ